MATSHIDSVRAEIADAVVRYQEHANIAELLDRLARAAEGADADALAAAVEPYRDIPEVAGPVYEKIVAQRPNDAHALVVLASAYWLSGRGPEVVGELASRAIAADPGNRGAWHLWALTEGSPRERTRRWRQVSQRFPEDDLARANLADNAASLAGAEHDTEALALAIHSYEELLARTAVPAQREALEGALRTLRAWRL
ncbi:MAG: hypothetical protein ACJ8AO_15870 [Gemmatimonadaceae bacterium]